MKKLALLLGILVALTIGLALNSTAISNCQTVVAERFFGCQGVDMSDAVTPFLLEFSSGESLPPHFFPVGLRESGLSNSSLGVYDGVCTCDAVGGMNNAVFEVSPYFTCLLHGLTGGNSSAHIALTGLAAQMKIRRGQMVNTTLMDTSFNDTHLYYRCEELDNLSK